VDASGGILAEMSRSRGVLAGLILTVAAVALAGALSSEQVQVHVAAGGAPLCRDGAALGRVRVVTAYSWRADQKEVARREEIAARGIRGVLGALPCAEGTRFEFATGAAGWPSHPEAQQLAGRSADTAILLRIHELGPNLVVTLLPPQWLGWSEVDVQARVLRVRDGAVLLDAHVHRARGGPFALRGVQPLESELRAALATLFLPAAVR